MRGIVSTIVIFVLAAIIFIVALWFLLSKAFPNILYQLEKLLGIIKPTPIESAIMCSIARCKYGCNSFRVKDIKWEEHDSSGRKIIVSCWERFCSGTTPDVYTQEDKICEKMPVIITLKNQQVISVDHLYEVTEGKTTEILSLNDYSLLNGLRGGGDGYTIVAKDEYIVSHGDPSGCRISGVYGGRGVVLWTRCYSSIEIKEGKFSIKTYPSERLLGFLGPLWYKVVIESV